MEPLHAFSTDTTDLPDDVVSQSKGGVNSLSADTRKIYELFGMKSPLDIDEVMFALYRLHSIKKTRNQISSSLARLTSKGFISRTGKGRYKGNV